MSDEMEATVGSDSVAEGEQVNERQSAIDKRIGRVIAQREDALSRLDGSLRENAELKAMVNQLQGRMEAFLESQQSGPKGVDKLSEQEILGLIQEQGLTDPQVLTKGVKELARREAESALSTARSEFKESQTRQLAQQEVNQQILQDFGPAAMKPESDLSKAALEIAGRVAHSVRKIDAQLGDALFDKAPALAWLVYAAAAHQTGAQAAKTAQQKLDVLQERVRSDAAVVAPAVGEAEASATRRAKLANGDWRSGLLQLPSLRRLAATRAAQP